MEELTELAQQYLNLLKMEAELRDNLELTRIAVHETGNKLNRLIPDKKSVILNVDGKKCFLRGIGTPVIFEVWEEDNDTDHNSTRKG